MVHCVYFPTVSVDLVIINIIQAALKNYLMTMMTFVKKSQSTDCNDTKKKYF